MDLNVLVDTSVWIDFFNDRDLPHVDLLAKVLRDHTPWTCDFILFEVLSGLRDTNRFAIIHSLLDELPFLEIGGPFSGSGSGAILSPVAPTRHYNSLVY